MLAIEVGKKQRYMVQRIKEKKTKISVSSIQKRFERGRAVVKPKLFMKRHKDIGK